MQAKCHIFRFFINQFKLFMYMRNNKSPKMESENIVYLKV